MKMLILTPSVVQWKIFFYQISECWRKLRFEFKLEDRRVAVRDPVLYTGQIVQNWAVILGLVEIGGVYNLFRRIYQYVEEICKEILFIGCFILRIYLQAFVLSTKKCADDESCDPPEDSPRHITLREQSSHKASYFRLLQKISIKNHWNSITTEKLSFELQIFSIWTGGRKDF